MSFNISVGKNGPLGRMLPSIIPGRLGEAGPSSVDCFDRRDVADAVEIRSNAHNGAVLFVQANVVMLKLAISDPVEVP